MQVSPSILNWLPGRDINVVCGGVTVHIRPTSILSLTSVLPCIHPVS
jgi:hypothetical protein